MDVISQYGYTPPATTKVKYWLWSDVQGLTTANANALADAYTQPGRHAADYSRSGLA